MRIEDKDGNVLYTEGRGDYKWYTLLASAASPKLVGTMAGDVLNVKRDKTKHLMRINNSYGFSDLMIQNLPANCSVKLKDQDGEYLIPRSVFLQKGTYLSFKKAGYETQLFLSLDVIHSYKIQ